MSAQENTEPLRSILGQFLVSLAQTEGYARNTVSAYQNDLNQLLEYLSQHYPALNSWSQVSGVMLNEFVDNLRLMKIARRGGEEKPIAPSTIARKIAALKSFFTYLLSTGLIEIDAAVRLEAPRVAKREPKTLTVGDVERLLAAPGQGNAPRVLRDRALLELLYATGMRVSELVALTIEDVGLTENSCVCAATMAAKNAAYLSASRWRRPWRFILATAGLNWSNRLWRITRRSSSISAGRN